MSQESKLTPFAICFIGRKLTEQGIFYPIDLLVYAKTPIEAIEKIAEQYEYTRLISTRELIPLCQEHHWSRYTIDYVQCKNYGVIEPNQHGVNVM